MKTSYYQIVCTVGLLGAGAAAWAGEPKAAPQEPAGFVTGAVIGGFAAGPFGAVVGAGVGTWLGNRVHRAGEAGRAEVEAATLKTAKETIAARNVALTTEKGDLEESNRALTARLTELSQRVDTAAGATEATKDVTVSGEAAAILDGLQGDVLFRTGSAELSPDTLRGLQVLAEAVAKSPALKVHVDGFADPRGSAKDNLELSKNRAAAVRDVFLAAGVHAEGLDVNAYGSSQSVAADDDGYALERRVRLTLRTDHPSAALAAERIGR